MSPGPPNLVNVPQVGALTRGAPWIAPRGRRGARGPLWISRLDWDGCYRRGHALANVIAGTLSAPGCKGRCGWRRGWRWKLLYQTSGLPELHCPTICMLPDGGDSFLVVPAF